MPFEQEWEEIHQKYVWGTWPNKFLLEFLDQNFEHNKPFTFLDIGCGNGANAIPMLERGWNVVAVDGSYTALCRLAERADKVSTGKLVLFKADINSLEFKAESLDGIIDGNSLSQMPIEEVVRTTQAARRWLKPNGKFYSMQLAEPYDHSFDRAYTRMCDPKDFKAMFRGYEGPVCKYQAVMEQHPDAVCSYYEFKMTLVHKISDLDFNQCELYSSESRTIMTVVDSTLPELTQPSSQGK